ncbi:MAG: HAMP domain-containing histidine kinase [Chloroflexi bacterium]|nr:HAMP domain-containing histidine kinase [Chloroflexota bacterium]
MPMFDRARLRLTLWYLAILAVIVFLLSFALYDLLATIIQQAEADTLSPALRRGVARFFARIASTQRALALEIAAIDLGVLILAALGAYVLAGRTLRPIQESMDRQQRFAAAASHELRTPLTVLQGTMEVALLRERTPAEYQQILGDAVAEAGRMGALIGDLLAVARAESDAIALVALEPLDLREAARAAVEGVRPLAVRKGQTLDVDLATPLPVRGDAVKLRQTLANLLDNAVTYTPEGGSIRLSGYRERDQAAVAVRDTGPGIEPRHLPRLFEPFYRVDTARGGGEDHAGLGLALAAWIARAHGGHLAVDSHVGAGSVFTLTLPLDQPVTRTSRGP